MNVYAESIINTVREPLISLNQDLRVVSVRGAGLGLAISHDVVTRKHGGSLTFSTALGEGTTFTIRLPIKRTDSIE